MHQVRCLNLNTRTTIADECQRQGQLAASFFFSVSSGSLERRSKRSFVTTLAYQLLQGNNLANAKSSMLSSIGGDPAIFHKSLKEQTQILILNPLRLSRETYNIAKLPRIIIVDGLDECDDATLFMQDGQLHAHRTKEDNQIEILSSLFQALHDPAFPFQIILASRPEPWIRRFFDIPAVADLTTEIFLHDKYDPDKDIALFLRSKFAELRRRYSLPVAWPGEVSS
jgi:hypothetical protein